MQIELNFSDSYKIDEVVNIPNSYYAGSTVKKLDDIKVTGKLYYDVENNLYASVSISGIMIIEDDISLEDV